MRITRRTLAMAVVAAAVPLSVLNVGGSAGAATWTKFKMSAGAGGSEPTLDIGRGADGDQLAYVSGTYGIPVHNKAWVRENNGVFAPVSFGSPYSRLPGGGDADMAMKGDDVWFIDLWAGSNSIQYSPDRGKTWTAGTPFTTLPLSDRQWIEVGPTRINPVTGARETTIYATYQFIQPGLGTWIARSRDNGVTWDFHAPIKEGVGTGTSGIPIDLVSDGGDRVAVAMISSGEPLVAVSTDAGETWDVTSASNGVRDAAGSLTGFTMNPDNPLEMAFSYEASNGAADTGVNHKTVVRLTDDGGATWSDLIRLDPTAAPNGPMDWFPWIDWRGDKIAVAWYQSNIYVPGRNSNNAKPETQWSVWYSESTDDGATFSAPEDIGSGSVKRGGICTQGLGCDADRELGDFLQVAIDLSGKTWIAFVNAGNSALLNGNGVFVMTQN